jgi:RHH-type proline utilization regulon transcriptional repressor/proline dehydrogenase/delta 1-pyrroline-5-carboxylate dehydrogenase
MIFAPLPSPAEPLRAAIAREYLADESLRAEQLLRDCWFESAVHERIQARALALVEKVRRAPQRALGVEDFLREYSLRSEEGVMLLCLAEALLRIPDSATLDRLIEDRLGRAHWERHRGHSESLFVNASTWGLMLAGRIVGVDSSAEPHSYLTRLAARIGEPAVRLALRNAIAILARQFVIGRNIDEALERAMSGEQHGYRHSFDMLGEAALTQHDAQRYYAAYRSAIASLAPLARRAGTIARAPGISVKLSALHPRFELAQHARMMRELVPRVLELARAARDAGIGLTLDAEEAERLEPTLDVFAAVYRGLATGEGFGIAVQAYQKRACAVVDWLVALGREHRRPVFVRLVKGAYWDSEIKRAQERGLAGYPVYTRKSATDVSYLACAERLLAAREAVFAQFATHNAHTVAAILERANGERHGAARDGVDRFEFQRLHGMGEALYREVMSDAAVACRVYAPVGSHEDLLPYLVRRLLENGANTSFLHHLRDASIPPAALAADPCERLAHAQPKPHPRIPLPTALYPERRNSRGVNLHDVEELLALTAQLESQAANRIEAAPLPAGAADGARARAVHDPADRDRIVGWVGEADAAAAEAALSIATRAQPDWDRLGAEARAACLERAGDLIERDRARLIALLIREGGKCVADADAEVRETADYCRYYALLARRQFAEPLRLAGPTGETNELQLHGRGAFACISPWNFPLAIFTGQVAAALAAGNSVLAKPASQTPLVAHAAVRLLLEAGIPSEVLHFIPGPARAIGEQLLKDTRLAGVALTGSTETGQLIQRMLAERGGPIVPLIAETGGLNAMIVDSSALPEQAAADALRSAFNSAGQRCSALRVLFVQEDIAPRLLDLIEGAMLELSVGDPALLATDVGPVIDAPARAALLEHDARMQREGRLICRAPLGPNTERGHYFAPVVFEIPRLDLLEREVFGPVLHVIRYAGSRLDAVIDAINRSGYGLTLGVHSRIDSTARRIQERARVGNTYVNRNQIGAVVGVQPFGGEGLSGTGPKAGGPNYLLRFALERTLTINTAAIGGNATLLALDE